MIMAEPMQFLMGKPHWDPVERSIFFEGIAGDEYVAFLIRVEALRMLVNADAPPLSPATALATFSEFEPRIHRIAEREHRSRGGRTVVLDVKDVGG
jgi:hypothetical protein